MPEWPGGGMRSAVKIGVSLAFALLAAGCNWATESQYYREGIGTDLPWAGASEATALQDQYLDYLCRQAAPAIGGEDPCSQAVLHASDWPIIVQAGMNDIDQRCDAFLSWVDYHTRNDQHWAQQISDTVLATETILRATNAATRAMDIVSAALGLGSHTFKNLSARLLTMADKTTIQSVVLNGQNKYRQDLLDPTKKIDIDNRPKAIYALRSYLRICLPFSIETQINSTVTIYEQGGTKALEEKAKNPLVNAKTVGTASITDVTQPLPGLPSIPTDPAARLLPQEVSEFQRVLCVKSPDGKLGSDTRKRILEFMSGQDGHARPRSENINERDISRLRLAVVQVRECGDDFKNPYEVGAFAIPADQKAIKIAALQKRLIRAGATTLEPPSGKLDPATRTAIEDYRKSKDANPKLGGEVDLKLHLLLAAQR